MNTDQPAQPMHVLDYAPAAKSTALSRWLRIGSLYLIAAIFGASACGLLAWAFLPEQYFSTAAIYLRSPGVAQSLGSALRANALASEAAMFESTPVVQVAKQRALLVTPSQWNEAKVHAAVERRTDLIRLTVTAPDPTAAASIAHAILNAYTGHLMGRQGQPLTIEVYEPPSTAKVQFNRPLISLLAITGALLACLVLFLLLRKRHSTQS